MAERTILHKNRMLSVLLGAGLVLAGIAPGAAQDRPRNVLEMLFGPPVGQVQRAPEPQPQVRRQQRQRQQQAQPRRNRQQQAAPRRQRQGSRNAARQATPPPAPAAPVVEKAENARDVLVVGDFLSASLARGLTESLADNRDVRIIGKAEGSSGLVRDDYYDWLAKLPELIEETDPELVVVMLGSNDRQAIRVDGASHPVRSDPWTAEYSRRAGALAEIVDGRELPLVWVGMPSFQSNRMSEDMVFFNDLYQRAAVSVDGEFVDIWNGFVDASGAFITSGPDPDGQPARLRNSDGITMAAAGTAKLAYYAEKPIIGKLGLSVDDMLVNLAPQQLQEGALPAVQRSPDSVRTAPVALNDPGLDGADALLGGQAASPPAAGPSPREQLVLAGTPTAGTAGRADSFNWSGKGAAVSPVTRENAIVFRGSTNLDALRSSPDDAPAVPPGTAPAQETAPTAP